MVTTRSQTARAPPAYEFLGPPGAFFIVFVLPVFTYFIIFACNDVSGCPAPSLLHPTTLTWAKFQRDIGWQGWAALYSTPAMLWTLGYYALSLVLWRLLPAQEVQGTVLANGARLTYRVNGRLSSYTSDAAFGSALAILAVFAIATLSVDPGTFVWTWIWDHYIQLLTANIIISYVLSAFVYIRSFQIKPGAAPDDRLLAHGGTTGNILYDYFIGRELNPPITIPVIGTVDIKSFMELRPGMLAWLIVNLASAGKQYANYGRITDSMVFVCITQATYIFDALWNEASIFTTMDIINDGFGFMLAFGDLVWVPFAYSLQGRYLAIHPVELGWAGCAGTLAVLGVGYYIFRAANGQKNKFRTNPNDPAVAHFETISTKAGTKLLVSGWWGAARHINYFGDWTMSWAYCLPTGIAGYVVQPASPFSLGGPADGARIPDRNKLSGGVDVVPGEARGWGMLITYFYLIYFAVLLVHRERRDEEKCRKKYGADWAEYCRRVKSRIIPGIY